MSAAGGNVWLRKVVAAGIGGLLVAASMVLLPAAVTAARAASPATPGTSIGNAGLLDTSGSGTIASGSDDWWLVYPAVPGTMVSVTITNNGKPDTCSNDISVNLDGARGTNDILSNAAVPAETAQAMSGTSASSDRYFVEVSTGRCSSHAPYTIKVTTPVGHPLIPPTAVSTPGSGIGNAWPPLHGHMQYTGHLLFPGNPEKWYALSKKAGSQTASIRIQNTTVNGSTSCGWINVTLQDSNGFADNSVDSATLPNNSAATLTVPAAGGIYYLWIAEAFNPCHEQGGATYTVEPEPSGQFTTAARAPGKASTPGTSIGSAWPPLQTSIRYTHTISFAGNTEDWYFLSKRSDAATGTIRVTNTTVDGSTACAFMNITLDDANGSGDNTVGATTLSNNSAATLTVPATGGPFYLWITEAGDPCHHTGAASYTVEVEPSGQFTSPSRPPSQAATPGTSLGAAWPPLRGGIRYVNTISFAGAVADWYALTRTASSKATTVRVVNTTVDGSTACAEMNVDLFDNRGAADAAVSAATLINNSGATLSVPRTLAGDPRRQYYLMITEAADPCHETGGATYTIELEPAAGWGTGAGPLPSGPSRKAAAGPLAGGLTFSAALPKAGTQEWAFFHANRAGTVRVQDTSAPTAGCKLDVTVGRSSAALSAGQIAPLRIPKAGTYDLELSVARSCRPKSPLSALIFLAGSFKGPALTVTDPTLKRGKVNKAYSATITVTGGRKPYAFTALTTLPPGLHLTKQTGAIVGQPTRAGTYTVMVMVTDSAKPARNASTAPIKIVIS